MATHEVKQPLVIKNGRFYRGDKEVPIKIGNSEQIALLKRMDRSSMQAAKNGIEVNIQAEDIQFEATVRFECICGNKIIKGEAVEDNGSQELPDEQAEEYWDRRTVTCRKCQREYAINDGRAYLKD